MRKEKVNIRKEKNKRQKMEGMKKERKEGRKEGRGKKCCMS